MELDRAKLTGVVCVTGLTSEYCPGACFSLSLDLAGLAEGVDAAELVCSSSGGRLAPSESPVCVRAAPGPPRGAVLCAPAPSWGDRQFGCAKNSAELIVRSSFSASSWLSQGACAPVCWEIKKFSLSLSPWKAAVAWSKANRQPSRSASGHAPGEPLFIVSSFL